jgi:glucose-1-phosphate cytidylyltransferase
MNKDIPVVILCGGMGTRLAEQTEIRPKPLVEIGGRPILWRSEAISITIR